MAIGKLKIGDKIARLPIIQGGMGVGVSRSSLAGAVAAAGGVGIISTPQIGYDEEGFIIRNSWGKSYCENGYSKLLYRDFNRIIEIWTIF